MIGFKNRSAIKHHKENILNMFRPINIGHKIIIGYLIILILMINMTVVLLFNLKNLANNFTFLVEHDQPVLANAYQLAKLIVDMETGLRGFLLTGQQEFLEPYQNGRKQFAVLLDPTKNSLSAKIRPKSRYFQKSNCFKNNGFSKPQSRPLLSALKSIRQPSVPNPFKKCSKPG
jgi:hypothetical protein